MSQLQRGVVKWFNDAKGYGFLVHETGEDVFVHYSVIESEGFRTLKDGEEVEYELRAGDKGLNASRVIRVNAPVSKSDTDTKAEAASQTLAAPNLETGSIATNTKSVTDMIEVERERDTSAESQILSEAARAGQSLSDNLEK